MQNRSRFVFEDDWLLPNDRCRLCDGQSNDRFCGTSWTVSAEQRLDPNDGPFLT